MSKLSQSIRRARQQYRSTDTRDLPELLAALQSSDWVVRNRAAGELRYKGDSSAVEPLLACLARNEDDRDVIMGALGMIGDERAIDALAKYCAYPGTAYIAASALSAIDSPRAVPPLVAGLRSPVAVIRSSSAAALGNRQERVAAPEIARLLFDNDAHVREVSVRALAEIGYRKAGRDLIPLLQDEAFTVVCETMRALSRLRVYSAAPDLLRILANGDPEEQFWAALALGHLRERQAIVPLKALLSSSKDDNWARHAAAEALGRIGDLSAYDLLLDALHHPDVVTRISAADGLGYLGHAAAIPALEDAILSDKGVDDFGESVREHARKALRRLRRVSATQS